MRAPPLALGDQTVERRAEEPHGPPPRLRLLEERDGPSHDLFFRRRGRLPGLAARDRFEVGVAELQHDRPRQELAPRRAPRRHGAPIASSSRRISSRSRRSSANVSSQPIDLRSGFGVTGRSSSPNESRRSVSAQLPTALRRTSSSAVRTSRAADPGGAQPARGHRPDAPQRVHRQLWRNRSTRSGAMTVSPSGFFQPDAIFARNLFGATPADAVRPRLLADPP